MEGYFLTAFGRALGRLFSRAFRPHVVFWSRFVRFSRASLLSVVSHVLGWMFENVNILRRLSGAVLEISEKSVDLDTQSILSCRGVEKRNPISGLQVNLIGFSLGRSIFKFYFHKSSSLSLATFEMCKLDIRQSA